MGLIPYGRGRGRRVRWVNVRRIPALDGLRGVAILLVVAVHAWPEALPAGGYGVTLFFVLSGFLITRILTRDDQVDFKRFYRNRALRLLPALVVFLVGLWLLTGVWSWHPMIYTANFAFLSDPVVPLIHTWSLAVEEHFYLIWPLVVAVTPRRRLLPVGIGLLAAAVGWRLWMVASDAGFFRINFGTDTAAFALLAGCVLALFRLKPLPVWVTWLAVGGIVFSAVTVEGQTDQFLLVEFVVVAAAVVAVWGCTQRVRGLEVRWLRWFGMVSYGLYLWHGAFLFIETLPLGLALAGSLAAPWLSWRFVETPMMRFKSAGDPVDGDRPRLKIATQYRYDPHPLHSVSRRP